jgi:hypothetical protein
MKNLNYYEHCDNINGCNIYDFSIIEHLESKQKPLYRFFSKEEYAKNFIKGEIRLSTLYSCRKLENIKARDENEGVINPIVSEKIIRDSNNQDDTEFISDLRMTGAINIGPNCKNITIRNVGAGSISMRDAFVLCTSNEISDYLITHFGKYCVRINYPYLLSYYLHLKMRTNLNSIYFRSDKVKYANQQVDIAKDRINKRIGFEKENRFLLENEFRSIFYTNKMNIQPYLEIVPEIEKICDYIKF